jgi:hypothetical protein
MQKEVFGSPQALLPYSPVVHPHDVAVDHSKSERETARFALGELADELIEQCCGSHSLGLIYRFLRNAGLDEAEARAQFELFLSGTLSEKLLDTAARCVES